MTILMKQYLCIIINLGEILLPLHQPALEMLKAPKEKAVILLPLATSILGVKK